MKALEVRGTKGRKRVWKRYKGILKINFLQVIISPWASPTSLLHGTDFINISHFSHGLFPGTHKKAARFIPMLERASDVAEWKFPHPR